MLESVLASFASISLAELLLIAAMALFASIVGGVAGYGTGALMPLVLVPVLGPEPVVPIIAISALFNNTWRALAFRRLIDWRRGMLVAAFATPTCILSAYGYTHLTGKGAAIVIGTMLMLTVPLRYLFKRYVMALDSKGLALGAVIYGGAVGGTVGAGVILLSILMAAGLQGAAVIATDAVISIVVTAVRMAVFGFSGVIDARVIAFALLIGAVALPGAFVAKAMVARMSLNVHTALLDLVVLIGGAMMIYGALIG
ncbi:MAG: TSUP family transporter [Rhizobiales bacterium]|nr:TSUP family transporter [Hyphomicrobiales bacterium]